VFMKDTYREGLLANLIALDEIIEKRSTILTHLMLVTLLINVST